MKIKTLIALSVMIAFQTANASELHDDDTDVNTLCLARNFAQTYKLAEDNEFALLAAKAFTYGYAYDIVPQKSQPRGITVHLLLKEAIAGDDTSLRQFLEIRLARANGQSYADIETGFADDADLTDFTREHLRLKVEQEAKRIAEEEAAEAEKARLEAEAAANGHI